MEKQSEPIFTNKGPLRTNSLKNQAYEQIKEAILYRRIKVGKVYSQDDFCTELGISRTPVREALIMLQSEGFISFVRGRGFRIKELSRKEALDIIELRKNIEAFGVQLAAQRITDEQIKRLQETYKRMLELGDQGDSILLYQNDYAFHEIIFEATGNTWLIDLNKKIRENFLRIENQLAFKSKKNARQVFLEHGKILDAISKKDERLAVRAMKYHMKHTAQRTLVNVLGTDKASDSIAVMAETDETNE